MLRLSVFHNKGFSQIFTLLVIFLIAISLPIAISLVQQKQDERSSAAENGQRKISFKFAFRGVSPSGDFSKLETFNIQVVNITTGKHQLISGVGYTTVNGVTNQFGDQVFIVENLTLNSSFDSVNTINYLRIDEPFHIVAKFCVNNQSTNVTDFSVCNLDLASDKIYDFSNYPLIPGDIEQNGLINSVDYSILKTNIAKINNPALQEKGDLNVDGQINSVDASLLKTYLQKSDEVPLLEGEIDGIPTIALTQTNTPTLTSPSSPQFCANCTSVLIGRPYIVRTGGVDELDQPFNEISLGNGRFRGFSANSTTYAIDGSSIFDMSGTRKPVISPGQGGSYSSCGNWLLSTYRNGDTLWGLIHSETACNYSILQSHHSVAIGKSYDNGLSWSILGQAFTGSDSPTSGKITGVGDGTIIDGNDSYVYAYVRRESPEWNTIVARAPKSDLSPASWQVWDGSSWSGLPVSGVGTSLSGTNAVNMGYWKDQNVVIGISYSNHGPVFVFSSDKVTFTQLKYPLIYFDDPTWTRPANTDLFGYPSIIADDGSNTFSGNHFILTYMYLPPGGDFSKKYLVMTHVWLTPGTSTVKQPPRYELASWINSNGIHRITSGPVINDSSAWNYDKPLGYVLSAADPSYPSIKLEECVGNWSGHADYLLTGDGKCTSGGYTRLRTAGWIYQDQVTGTTALYRCYSSSGEYHFASIDAQCDGLGEMEWRLGFILTK